MNTKLVIAGIATFAVLLGTMVALTPAMATHRSDHKVVICHVDPGSDLNDPSDDTLVTISVGSQAAVNAHLNNHQYPTNSDALGPCP